MNDDEIKRALQALGIDASSREVVALLPVAWVAWADGTVQPAERDLILEIASSRVALGDEGRRVLDNWLAFAPSRARIEAAAGILLALSMKSAPRDDQDVVEFCRRVAEAAGPILGKIEAPEREALETVAKSLAVEPHAAWEQVRARLLVESSGVLEDGWFDDEVTNPHRVLPPSRPASVPPRDGAPGLWWFAGDTEEHAPVGERCRIGRGRDNDVQLHHDGELSRHHCELSRRDGKIYVKDLGSLNGTVVEGDRVTERRLFGGELIVLGETSLRFRA